MSETFTYDANGNIFTRSDFNGETTADANDRLLTAGSTLYSYDLNGNAVYQAEAGQAMAYTYDVDNRLRSAHTPSSAIGYAYDADCGSDQRA
jgi:YD repeat-containing protein